MTVLAGTQNAVPLYPSHPGQAGGMTYRPAAGASEAGGAHTPAHVGSTPTPATTFCPWPKANGRACGNTPIAVGVCAPHSRPMARAVAALMQGVE